MERVGCIRIIRFFSEMMMFIGAAMANQATNNWWRDELARRGHAQYNQTTGAWEWRDEGKGGWE